ncbi:hypothetical protein SADUNF_Sadunf18G0074500 [Salix dunnii]|uniref:glycerol-1-phosphatase n=1 Tax=Salix dunnii TaxID=1413687 RepID=A0A835MDP7_9ROSI|nr:hypothetical protein SADUNF_Sadunf18G0074500 [Salix dunnii]
MSLDCSHSITSTQGIHAIKLPRLQILQSARPSSVWKWPILLLLFLARRDPSLTSSSTWMVFYSRITLVLWSVNGLLPFLSLLLEKDTEKFYTEVQEIILARYNKTFDWSLKAKMMGKKAMESARIFVEETGISDSLSAENFLAEREAMLQNLFPTSDLMPGASRLIKHLHAKGIPIAVATGSHKRHFDLKTQRHGGLFSLMHHIVLGDDPEVKQGKPSPDVFLAAARRFEGGPVDPLKILVFEDAPAGVLAAKNAGMSAVMVPDPRLDSSYHETADQVLGSLLDFNPNYWGLPPFEDVES